MKTLYLFFGSILTFITPVKYLFLLILLATLFDTAYSIAVSIKVKGRGSFRSKILRLGLSHKLFKYFGTTFLLYLIDMYVFGGAIFSIPFLLTKSISMIWVYVEMKSWDENNQLLGNRPIIDIAKEALGLYSQTKKQITETLEETKINISSEGDSTESIK